MAEEVLELLQAAQRHKWAAPCLELVYKEAVHVAATAIRMLGGIKMEKETADD